MTAKYHSALGMLLLSACAPALSAQADRDDDTVYRNSAGQEIALSANHLIVMGHANESRNCSAEGMQCWSFGKKVAFLAPVKCSDDVISEWSASGYTVLLKGVVPHTNRILLRMQSDNQMQYVYGKNDGVSEIRVLPSWRRRNRGSPPRSS